jgi:serine/threonine protein kinase
MNESTIPNLGECPELPQLELLLLGKLGAEGIKDFGEHFLHCRQCAAFAESVDLQDELTRSLANRSVTPLECDTLRSVIAKSQSLVAAANRADRTAADAHQAGTRQAASDGETRTGAADLTVNETGYPQVPGFEILGTLGMGGMGVVYRARQRRLNRIVALKMIRAHALFDVDSINRFRVEAESIARLSHPNIISIYEVGEANQLPFVALEYVSGGSLAELTSRTAVTSRVAAQLVAKLALALQYAHDRGVIHRDIKPANVLLAPQSDEVLGGDAADRSASIANGEPIDRLWFEPKITDFGLARLSNLDDRQTRSGAIIGTPAYMAPEQALGKQTLVGPAADIYSVGAILYELLTGRPPFRAESSVETLRQVIDNDPLAPRALNVGVPPDLETICLKCLHKQPAGRYAIAADLAVDLDRYLQGKPVLARPLSAPLRVARWCRRRPAIASLLATTAALLIVTAIGSTMFAVRVANLNRAALQAKQNSDNDRSVAVTAITELSSALYQDLSRRGGTVRDREQLIGVALAGLQRVTQDETRLADAGILQAHLATAELHRLKGDLESARQSLHRAHDLATELVTAFPDNDQHAYALAQVHQSMAEFVYETAGAKNSIPELETATGILQRLIQKLPDNPDYLRSLLAVRRQMVSVYETRQDLAAVYRECSQYLPMAERLNALTGDRGGRDVLGELRRLMHDAAWQLGNPEVAEQHGDSALAHFAELKREAPEDDKFASLNYWIALQTQAMYYAQQGRHDEATKNTDAAIAGYRQLAMRDPESLESRFFLAEGLRVKCDQSYYLYDYARVRAAAHESIEILRDLIDRSPTNHRYKAFFVAAAGNAMECAKHTGDWRQLDQLLEEAVTVYRSIDPEHIDSGFEGSYGPVYESIWEATRRHLANDSGPQTADGTCALLCIYAYLEALPGRYELSTQTRADIARTCGFDLANQDALFTKMHQLPGRTEHWLATTLIHEAMVYGFLAQQATDDQHRTEHLQRAVAAIKRVKQEHPVIASHRLFTKGELNWVRGTELYKTEID